MRVVDRRVVEVLVPFLPTGPATLVIIEGSRAVAEGELMILPPPSRRVVLSVKGGQVALVRVTPAADPPTGNLRRRHVRRLSYDVLNEKGGLVLTGSVLHPSDGGELLHDPAVGRLRRTAALDSTTIAIVIPRIDEPHTLVVYDTPPGIDLAEADHRARRRRLASIALSKGGNP
ncbi:MAG: hypothetical protein OEO21_11010 [Candidatus Krumholzibacteria bacterium]|nr:hypothetical protein [Candidatus Krumholzibacteria bacterium]